MTEAIDRPLATAAGLTSTINLDGSVVVFVPAHDTDEFEATALAGRYLADAGITATLKANPSRVADGRNVRFAVSGMILGARTTQLMVEDY